MLLLNLSMLSVHMLWCFPQALAKTVAGNDVGLQTLYNCKIL